MRSLLPLLLLLAVTIHAQPAQLVSADAVVDASAIAAEILQRLDGAWNQADGAKFAAEFTTDADVINIFGAHFRGRADISERMKRIFETIFKGSAHRSRKLEMARYVGPDSIVVLSSSVVDVPSGPLAPQTKNRQTFLLVKSDSRWQIRHWHNTTIRDQ